MQESRVRGRRTGALTHDHEGRLRERIQQGSEERGPMPGAQAADEAHDQALEAQPIAGLLPVGGGLKGGAIRYDTNPVRLAPLRDCPVGEPGGDRDDPIRRAQGFAFNPCGSRSPAKPAVAISFEGERCVELDESWDLIPDRPSRSGVHVQRVALPNPVGTSMMSNGLMEEPPGVMGFSHFLHPGRPSTGGRMVYDQVGCGDRPAGILSPGCRDPNVFSRADQGGPDPAKMGRGP